MQPVYTGEIQARGLGVKVEAFDEQGESLIGEMGELVIAEPMPSMSNSHAIELFIAFATQKV